MKGLNYANESLVVVMADAGSYLMLPIRGRIKEVKVILTLFLERKVEALHPQKLVQNLYLHLLEKSVLAILILL